MAETTSNPTGHRSHKNYYTALYQAALTISSSLELGQVLQGIVRSTSEAMRVKACSVRLLDPSTGQLRLSASDGLSENYLAKGAVLVDLSLIDSEVLHGNTVQITDVRTDPRFQYQDAARDEGLISILCVPLEVHGVAIGVMRVYADNPTHFEEDDVKFLSVLARLAALAIENARLYESVRSSYEGVMAALWGEDIPLP